MPDDPELSQTSANSKIRININTYNPVDDYLNSLATTLGRIKREDINAVIEVLFTAWKERRQVFILGNGGCAATASHMANDLCKLASVNGKKRFKAISLTENVPLITAWANDTNFENVFAEQLVNFLEPFDVVIAISTSGNSPSVLRALQVAQENGAVRVGLTGVDGGQLKELVDYCVFIPDEHMGRQEDGILILNHIISNTLRCLIAGETL